MERFCKDCKYFIQHYIQWYKTDKRTVYTDVNCGHCIKRNFRDCKPDKKACDNWE